MKLWDKGQKIDQQIESFTVGDDREIDLRIAEYDVKASMAHARMLEKSNLISKQELEMLIEGLTALQDQIESGSFTIDGEFEDVHSKIEYELTSMLGEVGKKIHTARSRNDQVLVALHLYFKANLELIFGKVQSLFELLLVMAERYQDYFLPGYTHFQRAMPSSFGQWFSAYAEILIDDIYQLQGAYRTVDQNPLGSAAGYGSSFPIDREETTRLLDFSELKINAMAAQLSRGKSERVVSGSLSSLAFTLNKLATDVCIFMNQEFNFISLPDNLTTGSSIMPHKKNPDVFELIRAKANKIQGLQQQIMLMTTNLPSGYHRDFQLLKGPVIDAMEDLVEVLDIMIYGISRIEVKQLDPNSAEYAHLFTVDSINEKVRQGTTFRDAYIEVAESIQDGTYRPNSDLRHTHIGSIHNLGLERIKAKFPELKSK